MSSFPLKAVDILQKQSTNKKWVVTFGIADVSHFGAGGMTGWVVFQFIKKDRKYYVTIAEIEGK